MIQEKVIFFGYDFKKYSDKDFLFTPNIYQGEYESIGLITLIYLPKAQLLELYSGEFTNEGKPIKKKTWKVEEYNSDDFLDKIYNLCVEMGSDAFTQMEILTHSESYAQNTFYPVTINGVKIVGFAIKRL